LQYRDEILLTIRENNPARGLLDLPGGFVDYHESLEQALCREIREELNLEIAANHWRYLFSFANQYEYSGILYFTSDAFFINQFETRPEIVVGDEISQAIWMRVEDITTDKVGLESVRRGICEFQKRKKQLE
jgi:ADP-ribose pyrophosphatase YjhB (NUDIX family)